MDSGFPRTVLTPKERRDRILKNRPNLRELQLIEDDHYGKDMGLLWAAYKKGSFNLPDGLEQSEFALAIQHQLSNYDKVWLVEDSNKAYSSGAGPVGIIGTTTTDLSIEAVGKPFAWATKRNVIRGQVAFLNMVKHSKKCGVLFMRADEKSYRLFKAMQTYDLLFLVGRVAQGSWLFSMRGRGS